MRIFLSLLFVIFLGSSGFWAFNSSSHAQDNSDTTPPLTDHRYVYGAKVLRVIDGDTLVADIDLGFNTWRRGEKLRLNRIDAPEIRGRNKTKTCRKLDEYPQSLDGCRSFAWLKDRIEGKDLLVRTVKNRKGKENKGGFGRYLVEVYLDGQNINNEMLTQQLAVIYKRKKRRKQRKKSRHREKPVNGSSGKSGLAVKAPTPDYEMKILSK